MELEDRCPVCGASAMQPGSGGTPLEQHIYDYDDPHRTLRLVPKTYYGDGAPVSTEGYKSGDWYVDIGARVIYSLAVENSEDGQVLEWVQASTMTAVTEARLASVLASYVPSSALASALSGYVTSAAAASFVTGPQLDARGYVTSAGIASMLSGYVTSAQLDARGFATTSYVSSALSGYVTSESLASALLGFYPKAASDERFASKSDVSGLVSSSDLDRRLSSGFVFRSPVSEGEWPELNLDTILGAYLTSGAAASTYLTKALAASTYITQAQLDAAVASCTTPASLAEVLQSYLTTSAASELYLSKSDASSTYLRTSDIPSAMSAYVLESSMAERLAPYVTQTSADARYAPASLAYSAITQSQLASALSSYVTSSGLAHELLSYLTKASASETYLSKSEASSNYLRIDGIPSAMSAYVLESSMAGRLAPYITQTAADARYALASTIANLVTEQELAAALVPYVTKTFLSAALAPYITSAAAAQAFVTPAYLESSGYLRTGSSFFSNFVTRASGPFDLDVVLAAWAINSISSEESRPVQSRTVRTAIDQVNERHDALAATVASLVITGGNADMLLNITQTSQHSVSGTNLKHLVLTDNATNWISSGDAKTLLGDGYHINFEFPGRRALGVARDFLFCVTFDGSDVGQVSFDIRSIVLRGSGAVKPHLISYAKDPFTLNGIVYGSTVIWAFTEYAEGKFAVTRKVLYPVEGFNA